MAKNQNKPKMNIPMCLAGVLFCLTLFSTYLVSGLYARYSTSGTGFDSARVIRFGDITIVETGDFLENTNNMLIVPGTTLTKRAVVNFTGSESATYVFVEVVTSEVAVGKIIWAIDDDWMPVAGTDNVYYRALGPNTPLEANILMEDQVRFSEDITKLNISELNGAAITFRASVVQSNGFGSPEDAWASLRTKGVQV